MVVTTYPKDTSARRIGSRAEAILHYKLNSKYWNYRQETGIDVGRDCVIELIDDGLYCNNKIEGQTKGTQNIIFINKNQYISFPLETKTVLYALKSRNAFVLFVVDIIEEKVYYQCLQDYFNDNKCEKSKIYSQKSINIKIPITRYISDENECHLQSLAKKMFMNNK